MIFKQFEPTDIVSGRTTKVASGFWPNGDTYWSASFFEHNFWELSNAQTPSTAYGSSPYDVRKTLYYVDIYPGIVYKDVYKEPYFSISYGHYLGSGSFDYETGSIKVSPTKAIYTQYKNLLLGTTDLDGKFTMKTGSSETSADDIFVINFSTYKMKDKIDEGVFEISFRGSSNRVLTFIDDSFYVGKVSSVYQLVTGSLNSVPSTVQYPGLGLLYPNDGIVVINANKLNELLGLNGFFSEVDFQSSVSDRIRSDGITVREVPSASYYTGSKSDTSTCPGVLASSTAGARWNAYLNSNYGNQNNVMSFAWSLIHSGKHMVVRKTEYVPSKHYFVRVRNRDFNYSNNPTYVYDGKESKTNGEIPAQGTIKNEDFYTDPKTYITTVGLYNDTNELVAIGKLSRPAVKSFENELLCKIRLDF